MIIDLKHRSLSEGEGEGGWGQDDQRTEPWTERRNEEAMNTSAGLSTVAGKQKK